MSGIVAAMLRFLESAARHPRLTLTTALIVSAASAASAARIRPAATMEAMLSHDDPAARALNRLVSDFSLVDHLIVVATIPTESALDRSKYASSLTDFAERLAAGLQNDADANRLVADIDWHQPRDLRRFIEKELVPAAVFYLDAAGREQLRARLTPAGMRAQLQRNAELLAVPGVAGGALSGVLSRDPLRLYEIIAPAVDVPIGASTASESDGVLYSSDGRSLMIRIAGRRPVTDLDFTQRFVSAVSRAAVAANFGRLELDVTGSYAIAATAERAIRRDMIYSISFSIVGLHLLFVIVYRKWYGGLHALIPVAVGTMFAFGLSAFRATELTPIVAVIGALLAGMGIDYAIHFIEHYRVQRQAGLGHEDATGVSLRALTPALMAACLTSVIGFTAIAQSDVAALRDFAVLGALGLTGILLATLTLTPALLQPAWWRNRGASTQAQELSFTTPPTAGLTAHQPRHSAVQHWTWVTLPLRRPKPFIVMSTGAAIVAVTLVLGAPNFGLNFETDLRVMHPQPNPPLDAQYALADRFGRSFDPLFVVQTSATEAELLTTAHEIKSRLLDELREGDIAVEVLNLATVLPNPAMESQARSWLSEIDPAAVLQDFDAALAESPFAPEAFADYREFLNVLLTATAPPSIHTLSGYPKLSGMLLARDVAVANRTAPPSGHSCEALTLVFPGRALADRRMRGSIIDALRNQLAGVPGATLTGMPVVGHDIERAIRRDLPRYLSMAFGLVGIFLVLYFRSVRAAALALLPIGFGLACTLALAQLFGLRLNMINLIAFPLMVGVGIDQGILLVSLSRGSADYPRCSLRSGCGAVVLTTLTTTLALGTLAFTSTPAIQSLGILLSISMFSCLTGTLFLLAPLLAWTHGRKPAVLTPQR